MPFFPRATRALSRYATPPRFPNVLQSWGQSGKGQMRATQSLGREWSEIYPILDTSMPSVRALIAAVNQSLREGTLWDVQHPYWHRRIGDPGAPGTPLVFGGGQTGSTLNIDGFWVNSCTAPINIDQAPWLSDLTPIVTPGISGVLAPDGTQTAVRIQDDNAAGREYRYFTATVPNNSQTNLAGVYVRKRALGGVYAAIGIAYTGGTAFETVVVINPETGGISTNATAANVIDVDANWWFVWIAQANNATGNTNMQVRLQPAYNNTGTTAIVSATVGSTDFWGVRIQLNTATPTLPVKPWLYTGEMISVAGTPVLLDIMADVVLLGATQALSIHPPILVGQSPIDNAVVQVDPSQFYFKAHLVGVDNFPDIDTTGYLEAGLTLYWREQPQ